MYYITNQSNDIIAADDALLKLLGAENIQDLYKKIALGEVDLELSSPTALLLHHHGESSEYAVEQSALTSMFGRLNVIAVRDTALPKSQEEESELFALIDDTPDRTELNTAPNEPSLLEEEQPEDIDIGSLLKVDQEESEELSLGSSPKEDEKQTEESDALFDLLLPEEEKERGDEISLMDTPVSVTEREPGEEESTPIVIDAVAKSEIIGITPEDYKRFLDEYIDTAIGLEKELHSAVQERRLAAIKTLSRLSDVLHLPRVNQIIEKIGATVDGVERKSHIATLYATLSRFTTRSESSPDTLAPSKELLQAEKMEMEIEQAIQKRQESNEEDLLIQEPLPEPVIEEPETEEPEIEESKPEIPEEPEEKITLQSSEPVEETPSQPEMTAAANLPAIDLSDVEPVHFDFRLEEAAEDLSLPVELIEEFINDFIAQAKVETPKMIEAYQQGDLETIQKIGHQLKGAAANLRIGPLADTLYEIQFCKEIDLLEPLVKDYWAHFLSFEKQMNLISK